MWPMMEKGIRKEKHFFKKQEANQTLDIFERDLSAGINIWLISKQRFFRQRWERVVAILKSSTTFGHICFCSTSVALGLSHTIPFGLGLKSLNRVPDPSLLPYIFTPAEFKRLVSQGLLSNKDDIVRLWGAKEAFLSFLGYKFCLPPSQIEITSLCPFRVRAVGGNEEEFILKGLKLYLGARPYLLSLVYKRRKYPKPLFSIKMWPSFEYKLAHPYS